MINVDTIIRIRSSRTNSKKTKYEYNWPFEEVLTSHGKKMEDPLIIFIKICKRTIGNIWSKR